MINAPAYQEFVDATGPLAENVTSATWWHPAERYQSKDVFGSTEHYTELFQKKFKSLPDFTNATGSASGVVLQMAIEKAGSTDRGQGSRSAGRRRVRYVLRPAQLQRRRPGDILRAAGVPDPEGQDRRHLSGRHQSRRLPARRAVTVAHAVRPGIGEWPPARRPLCMHRGWLLAGLGRAQRHQYPARIVHRAGRLSGVLCLYGARHPPLCVRANRRARVVRARIRDPVHGREPGHRSARAGHHDGDLRACPAARQPHAGRLQGRFPQDQPECRRSASSTFGTIIPGLEHCRAGRSPGQHAVCASIRCPALPAAAPDRGWTRHRRGAHGPLCRDPDGRRSDGHLCRDVRPRRSTCGRRRRAAQPDLSDLAARRHEPISAKPS